MFGILFRIQSETLESSVLGGEFVALEVARLHHGILLLQFLLVCATTISQVRSATSASSETASNSVLLAVEHWPPLLNLEQSPTQTSQPW